MAAWGVQNRPDDPIFTRPYNQTRLEPTSVKNLKINVDTRPDIEPTQNTWPDDTNEHL